MSIAYRVCLRIVRLLLTMVPYACLQAVPGASAQDWPTRPVTMVVPFAVGGTTDVVARILGPGLSEHLRQQVVVDNVGGAAGTIGTVRVAKARPDGYHFLLGNIGTHGHVQSLYREPPYDAVADFAPVALLVDQPMLLVVRKDFPAANLQEFIAHTRANQAKLQYGSAGAGSPTHLACALLDAAIGISTTHIPYRGGGPAIQDLLAGRIDWFCFNTASIMPHIVAGNVRAITMLSKSRSQALPSLATAHEQGLTDFEIGNWLAFFLPKGTPDGIVHRLNAAAVATIATPVIAERLKQLGAEPVAHERQTPEYLRAFVPAEIAKWAPIIRAANIKAD